MRSSTTGAVGLSSGMALLAALALCQQCLAHLPPLPRLRRMQARGRAGDARRRLALPAALPLHRAGRERRAADRRQGAHSDGAHHAGREGRLRVQDPGCAWASGLCTCVWERGRGAGAGAGHGEGGGGAEEDVLEAADGGARGLGERAKGGGGWCCARPAPLLHAAPTGLGLLTAPGSCSHSRHAPDLLWLLTA